MKIRKLYMCKLFSMRFKLCCDRALYQKHKIHMLLMQHKSSIDFLFSLFTSFWSWGRGWLLKVKVRKCTRNIYFIQFSRKLKDLRRKYIGHKIYILYFSANLVLLFDRYLAKYLYERTCMYVCMNVWGVGLLGPCTATYSGLLCLKDMYLHVVKLSLNIFNLNENFKKFSSSSHLSH
jgi:hypothetical protein